MNINISEAEYNKLKEISQVDNVSNPTLDMRDKGFLATMILRVIYASEAEDEYQSEQIIQGT